jgi:hypothetical protein
VRHRASERRQARLHQLDAVEAVARLAHRQADEGDHHEEITAELVGDLEGKIQQRARQDVDRDDHHHYDQRRDADELADPLDDAFREPVRGRTVLRAALLCLRHLEAAVR